jgi:hypothetical protein
MKEAKHWLNPIARIGLVAKGIIYLVLGCLAFMAAFEIGGQEDTAANRKGVFHAIKEAPGGLWLLILLSAGLICYSVWRGIEALSKNNQLKWSKRLRYLFSGLTYLSVAYTAIRIIGHTSGESGDANQHLATRLMQTMYGQWLLGLLALVMAGTGIYQLWYGLSEKYKKHVQQLGQRAATSMLLYSGKIGYVARGVVWLLIAYLLLQAALHANANEAGDSGKAFLFIENTRFGSYLLGIIGIGLMAYGFFSFIRARYESFQHAPA